MRSAKAFFNWAFSTRAKSVMKIYNDEPITPEKMFLSFCSHDPTFISHGPAGLNGSIKGIGFMPKPEYLEETLEAYIKHIKTYDPEDKTYSKRGLGVLIKYMYGEEAHDRIDFEAHRFARNGETAFLCQLQGQSGGHAPLLSAAHGFL